MAAPTQFSEIARPPRAKPRAAWFAALLIALCACVSLRGCGVAPQPVDTRLEFWTLSLKPTFTEYIESRIDAFEAEHPGVDVVWVDVPFDAVERKLIAAAAADRAPDVVNLSDLMFARFAGAGAFLDLSDHLPTDPRERYHAGALAVGELGDALYALPWYLTTQTMIVNEPALAERGLSLDTLARDWPGLIEQARNSPSDAGPLFTQPLGVDSQIPMMLLADGRPPFRAASDGTLEPDLTRPDVVEFVTDWVELYRDARMPREAATNGFEHLISVYQDERVAVLNTGANFLRRVRGISQRVYDQTVVLPPVTGSLGRAHVAVMPLCVSARTEHPELAAELAWFITSPESQLEFCQLATILPSTPAALADTFFAGPTDAERADGLEKVGTARAIVATALADAVAFTPRLECWPDLRRAFNDGIKRALLAPPGREVDAEQTLADINTEWARIIDAMNRERAGTGAPPATMDAIPTPPPVSSRSTAGAHTP